MAEKGLLSVAELKEMEEYIVGLGPRLTGCAAHDKMINFISSKMTEYGYEVKEDYHTFKRWEPSDWALSYEVDGERVEVAKEDLSYYPYSGLTPDEGVSGRLKYVGKFGIDTFYCGCRGKIAVIKVPMFEASCGLVFKKRAVYPETFVPPTKQASPVVATFVIAPLLGMARRAGAKGVICIMSGCSDGNAKHQYLPFIKKYAGMPSLWVNESDGEKIIAAAKKKGSATLKLTGSVQENAPTKTLYAVLKGQSDKESILVNTHTDGTNAFEENAAIGVLSLAKYFAEKPVEERKKNIVFSFVTGHFQLHQFGNALNQATTKFLNAHPEFWAGKEGGWEAVAGLTLEHLGCTEWRDTPNKKEFVKVSDVDPELVYTSNKIMSDLYIEQCKGRSQVKTLMLRPKNLIHFGEGQPIYKKGIPSASLCPGPDYLCNVAPNGYIDKINYEMMSEQIDTFRKMVEVIDGKTRKELGRRQGFAIGLRF